MALLTDKITINGMELRNRLVLPPLTTRYGTPEGQVTDEVVQFYEKRTGALGLAIVEAASVRNDGRIMSGSLGIWDDMQIDGMARLAKTIKDSGAGAVVQINHAGARGFPAGGEMQGAAPSGVFFRPDVTPFAMSKTQIDALVSDFAAAAGRMVEAGFDGIEIHGAHLYLISQFLSPLTNQRQDEYGGDAKGRSKLAVRVVQAVREKVGQQVPLLFRLNVLEHLKGGQTLPDAIEISRILAAEGVDALHVSLVTQGHFKEMDDGKFLVAASAFSKKSPDGANIPYVHAVRKAAGLPVIGVGKMGNDTAQKSVAGGFMDLVAIGRQMIADPETAAKVLNNRVEDIIPCKECMACFASLGKGPLTCEVNKDLPEPC